MPLLCFCIFFAIICTLVHHFNGSCKAPNSLLMGLKSLFIYLEDSVPEMDPTLNAEVFSSSLHLCDFATFFLHSHLPLQRGALSIRLHFQNLTCRTSLYIQSRYFPGIIFSRTGPQGDYWIFSPTSTYTLFSVCHLSRFQCCRQGLRLDTSIDNKQCCKTENSTALIHSKQGFVALFATVALFAFPASQQFCLEGMLGLQ